MVKSPVAVCFYVFLMRICMISFLLLIIADSSLQYKHIAKRRWVAAFLEWVM